MKIIQDIQQSPEKNMLIDQENLKHISHPLLRFYEWEQPSATYGYFINPEVYFIRAGVDKYSLKLARRPSGGGIIFHTGDLAFSLIVPNTHPFYHLNPKESYFAIHQRVGKAISEVLGTDYTLESCCKDSLRGGFCMAKATIYDIMYKGKKVGGAAERRTQQGLLHQGSLFLAMPPKDLIIASVKGGAELLDAMERASYPLGEEFKDQLKEAIAKQFLGE